MMFQALVLYMSAPAPVISITMPDQVLETNVLNAGVVVGNHVEVVAHDFSTLDFQLGLMDSRFVDHLRGSMVDHHGFNGGLCSRLGG